MSSDALQVVESEPGSVSFTYKSASVRAEWLSRDPIAEEGGINLYGYVANSPTNLSDPLGLSPVLLANGQWADDDMNNPQQKCFLLRYWNIEGGNPGLHDSSLDFLDFAMLASGAGNLVKLAEAGLARVFSVAAKAEATVIGRVKDLQKLGPGEKSLLDRLPDLGSPKAKWQQNSGVLRQEMNRGLPIRDASVGDTGGQFLNAERNLLRDRGWTFEGSHWNPPN